MSWKLCYSSLSVLFEEIANNTIDGGTGAIKRNGLLVWRAGQCDGGCLHHARVHCGGIEARGHHHQDCGQSNFRAMNTGTGPRPLGRNLDEDDPNVCGRFVVVVVSLKRPGDYIHDAVSDRHEGCGDAVGQVGVLSKLTQLAV